MPQVRAPSTSLSSRSRKGTKRRSQSSSNPPPRIRRFGQDRIDSIGQSPEPASDVPVDPCVSPWGSVLSPASPPPNADVAAQPSRSFSVCIDARLPPDSDFVRVSVLRGILKTVSSFVSTTPNVATPGSYLISGITSTQLHPKFSGDPPTTFSTHHFTATDSFIHYAALLTKVSQLLLRGRSVSRSKLRDPSPPTNAFLVLPEDNISSGPVDEEGLGNLVASCVRTISSLDVESLTFIVVHSMSPTATSRQHLRCLEDSFVSASNSRLKIVTTGPDPDSLRSRLREASRPPLPPLSTTFWLPQASGSFGEGSSCSLTLDVVPRVLPFSFSTSTPPDHLLQFLQSSSISSTEIVHLIPTDSVDYTLLFGVPFLARPTQSCSSINEYRSMCLLLEQLCRSLRAKDSCLLLRTRSPNPMSKLHDFYLVVPEDGDRAMAILQVATSEQALPGECEGGGEGEDNSAGEGDEALQEEREAYGEYIAASLKCFNRMAINPDSLDWGKMDPQTDAENESPRSDDDEFSTLLLPSEDGDKRCCGADPADGREEDGREENSSLDTDEDTVEFSYE